MDMCYDELNIVINYLPLKDIWSIRLLNKYYDKYINTDFKLESYVCEITMRTEKIKRTNMEVIKKHAKNLTKI